MTPSHLVSSLKLVFGEVGWGTQGAAALGIDPTSLSRYANDRADIPGPVAAAVWGFVQVYKLTGERPKPVRKLQWK